MSRVTPSEAKNLDSYGSPLLEWEPVLEKLKNHELDNAASFLCTTRPDGRPHVVRVGAIWRDGTLIFVSGPRSRKSLNLAENQNCALAVSLAGIDVSFEGEAIRVTDPARVAEIAAIYGTHGWPAEVEGDAVTGPYNASGAGAPPWYFHEIRVDRVFGSSTAEPYGATRWTFTD